MTGQPEVDAILERAWRYLGECYARDGYPPERFLVSEREYACLEMHLGGPTAVRVPSARPRLFGMHIMKPVRMRWDRNNAGLEHVRLTRIPPGIVVGAEIPVSTMGFAETCRTSCPLTYDGHVTCPCGEVIWEIPHVRNMMRGPFNDDGFNNDEEIFGALAAHERACAAAIRGAAPPPLDSEITPMDDWEVGVKDMIADVKRRYGSCTDATHP